MSSLHVSQIRNLAKEFKSSHTALSYIEANWNMLSTELEVWGTGSSTSHRRHDQIGLVDVRKALSSIEATFTLRIFATFEEMLRQHIAQHHPQTQLKSEVSSYWLIDRVAKLQTQRVSSQKGSDLLLL